MFVKSIVTWFEIVIFVAISIRYTLIASLAIIKNQKYLLNEMLQKKFLKQLHIRESCKYKTSVIIIFLILLSFVCFLTILIGSDFKRKETTLIIAH